jgi:hypothetical protein
MELALGLAVLITSNNGGKHKFQEKRNENIYLATCKLIQPSHHLLNCSTLLWSACSASTHDSCTARRCIYVQCFNAARNCYYFRLGWLYCSSSLNVFGNYYCFLCFRLYCVLLLSLKHQFISKYGSSFTFRRRNLLCWNGRPSYS